LWDYPCSRAFCPRTACASRRRHERGLPRFSIPARKPRPKALPNDNGLRIFDISDPLSPTLASVYDPPELVTDVAAEGNLA
jgi:hypothetical protein